MSDLNYTSIQLPSKCLPYEGINPGDITIRPYNGADEMILAQINPATLERNFLTVLRNVIRGIDPEKLTTGDRLYIILWEYIISYSETIVVKQLCSNCLQNVEFEINLAKDINIIQLPDNYTEPKEITLPVSGETYQVRALNIGDEVAAEKRASEGRNPFLYRYARTILNPKENTFILEEHMKEWHAKDLALLRKYQDIDSLHGPSSETIVKCPHCGEEDEVIVPFRFEFFHPAGEALGRCFRKRVSIE